VAKDRSGIQGKWRSKVVGFVSELCGLGEIAPVNACGCMTIRLNGWVQCRIFSTCAAELGVIVRSPENMFFLRE
jgi:hypothetical protein